MPYIIYNGYDNYNETFKDDEVHTRNATYKAFKVEELTDVEIDFLIEKENFHSAYVTESGKIYKAI